MVIVDY